MKSNVLCLYLKKPSVFFFEAFGAVVTMVLWVQYFARSFEEAFFSGSGRLRIELSDFFFLISKEWTPEQP